MSCDMRGTTNIHSHMTTNIHSHMKGTTHTHSHTQTHTLTHSHTHALSLSHKQTWDPTKEPSSRSRTASPKAPSSLPQIFKTQCPGIFSK